MCREVQARGRHPGKTGPSETAVFWRCEDHETPTGFWCMLIWLVIGTWFFYDFPYLLGMSSSQLTNSSFFRGVGQPPTRYLYYISHILTIILTNSCLFLDFNVQQLHHQDDESKILWIPVWIPRKRKPGGRLLRIFGNLLPGVLMCIDVYCCILFVW